MQNKTKMQFDDNTSSAALQSETWLIILLITQPNKDNTQYYSTSFFSIYHIYKLPSPT